MIGNSVGVYRITAKLRASEMGERSPDRSQQISPYFYAKSWVVSRLGQ
jgi:hypothetical protein